MAKPSATTESKTPVTYSHSSNLADVLHRAGVSLLISTYQAGKVITVGTHQQALEIRFHHFDQAMGLARTSTGLAIGSRRQIWFLRGHPELASQIEPKGHYDVAFLTQQAHHTGPLMGHEMAFANNELWFLNTLFSCLCTIQPDYHFVPRWKPPFIDQLVDQDRCHLNGLAFENNAPRYVTVLGETNTAGGWRANKASGGCLIDVPSNSVVVRGLSMPHSPRVHGGRVFVLNSGYGHLSMVDPPLGKITPVTPLPGYTRGMDCHGSLAFVGLSRIRETNIFGGLPIAERHDELLCGVAVIDLTTGQTIATLQFQTGVEEIFEVKVIPGYRNPILAGPMHDTDETAPIWLAKPLI